MTRGKDEAHNPNRRPQRPQTDEEKMAIVKQVFPNAQEVVSDVDEDEEIMEQLTEDARQKSYDDDEFNPPERAEDAHLDMEYESRYDNEYFYDDDRY